MHGRILIAAFVCLLLVANLAAAGTAAPAPLPPQLRVQLDQTRLAVPSPQFTTAERDDYGSSYFLGSNWPGEYAVGCCGQRWGHLSMGVSGLLGLAIFPRRQRGSRAQPASRSLSSLDHHQQIPRFHLRPRFDQHLADFAVSRR